MKKKKKKKGKKTGSSDGEDGEIGSELSNGKGWQGRSDRELKEFMRQVRHSCTGTSYSLSKTVLPDGYFPTLCSLLAKNITLEELDLSEITLKP